MSDEGVDFSHAELFGYASPERSLVEKIRFALAGRENGGKVTTADQAAIRSRLEASLETVTYSGGAPVFVVRDATGKKRERGSDFVVEVLTDGAQQPLKVDGVPLRSAIRSINRLSGTHGRKTPGIFIAAGPDIDPTARPEELRIIDVPPTLLYAIGLPVAEDFAGRALTELFTETFRATHSLQTIPTWGAPTEGENRASEVDEELVDQLRALGYIE